MNDKRAFLAAVFLTAVLAALVVVASPRDLADYHMVPFDVVRTLTTVRAALDRIPSDVLASVEGATAEGVVGPPTLDTLCERIRAAPYTLLHFVCHGGGSALTTHHTHSRLQHTLGVFALVAQFWPDDDVLRVAALLHDVGHAPFSHALEQLDGVDHHRWTIESILAPPVADILAQHGFEPQSIVDCVNGNPATILKNHDGILHADHLDSWVRSAQAGGILPQPAQKVLEHLRINPLHALREVARVLKPSGRLILSTPNVGPLQKLMFLMGRDYQGDIVAEFNKLETVGHMGHFRLYTPGEVRRFIEEIGLRWSAAEFRGDPEAATWKTKLFCALYPRKDRLRPYVYVTATKPSGATQRAGSEGR